MVGNRKEGSGAVRVRDICAADNPNNGPHTLSFEGRDEPVLYPVVESACPLDNVPPPNFVACVMAPLLLDI